MEISVARLNNIFSGKPVKITHTGNRMLSDGKGVCKEFVETEGGVDLVLTSGARWGIVPDTLTETSVEGKLAPWLAGRRIITICE